MSPSPPPLLNPYLDLFRDLEALPDELRLRARKRLIWAFSWAVPDAPAIQALVEAGPWIELGAGSGYWAWLLRQAGGDVVALDREPAQPPSWSQVLLGDEATLPASNGRGLFMCWPPLDQPMARLALQNLAPGRVAVVGEVRGRTGDAALWDLLERHFELTRELAIPTWPGFEDRLRLYRRVPVLQS